MKFFALLMLLTLPGCSPTFRYTSDGVHGEPRQLTNIDFICKSAAYEETNGEMPDQHIHYEDGIGVRSLLIDKYIMGALGKGVFQQARVKYHRN